jgi:hypothetical protein
MEETVCEWWNHHERKTQHVGVVCIATGYGLDNWGVGVRVPVGARIFTSPCRPDWLWGPLNLLSYPIHWVLWALSPVVKRQGRETDHSPPASTAVKKMWIYISTPHGSSWRSAQGQLYLYLTRILCYTSESGLMLAYWCLHEKHDEHYFKRKVLSFHETLLCIKGAQLFSHVNSDSKVEHHLFYMTIVPHINKTACSEHG